MNDVAKRMKESRIKEGNKENEKGIMRITSAEVSTLTALLCDDR
jgi:hypothetical protein